MRRFRITDGLINAYCTQQVQIPIFNLHREQTLTLMLKKKKSPEWPLTSHGLFFSTVSWNSDVSIKHLPINYSWSSKTPLPPAREVRPCRLKCSVSLVYFVRMLNGQPRKKPVRTPLLPIRNREHEGRNIPDEDECSVALTKSYTDLFSLWLTRIKWQVKRTQSLSPASAYSVTPFQSLFTCITQV